MSDLRWALTATTGALLAASPAAGQVLEQALDGGAARALDSGTFQLEQPDATAADAQQFDAAVDCDDHALALGIDGSVVQVEGCARTELLLGSAENAGCNCVEGLQLPASPDPLALDEPTLEGAPDEEEGEPSAFEVSGETGAELRVFPADPADARQFDSYDTSLYLQPRLRGTFGQGRLVLTFAPFVRVDQYDPQRTHADLREALIELFGERWDLAIGFGRAYWGVTEFVHLVNIVNQTDWVEDFRARDFLGQPMLRLGLRTGRVGKLSLFLLPMFRRRTFPSVRGRPRISLPIVTGGWNVESSLGRWSPDPAARWSGSAGEWDFGLSYFYGTSRDPTLQVVERAALGAVLQTRYETIQQVGLDVQWTHEGWLLKLEAIHRALQGSSFFAATGGIEYTFNGVFGTSADLGTLIEYMWDGRDNQSVAIFDNDLAAGFRLALNDVSSTEMLAATIVDLDSRFTIVTVELSRRLPADFKAGVEARAFFGSASSDPVSAWRSEDHLVLELGHYF